MEYICSEPQCICEGVFYKTKNNELCRSVLDIKFSKEGKKVLIIMKSPTVQINNINNCLSHNTQQYYGSRFLCEKDNEFGSINQKIKKVIIENNREFDISLCRIINFYDSIINDDLNTSIFNEGRGKELDYFTKNFDVIIPAMGCEVEIDKNGGIKDFLSNNSQKLCKALKKQNSNVYYNLEQRNEKEISTMKLHTNKLHTEYLIEKNSNSNYDYKEVFIKIVLKKALNIL